MFRRRPPSVSGDDCCIRLSQFWSLHLLVWLCRPMREWQSLPHRRQVWNVAAWSMEQDLLRAALFSFRWSVRSCSACLVPQCTAALQESLDSARLSHDWMSIDALFRSLLQVSLKRSLGRPLDLAPLESSPYSKSLGMRPSAIRRTWPNQRRRRWLRSMKMDGSPARSSTTVFGILSCHRMLSMRLRQRRWKLFSLFSWAAHVVQVSLE